MSQGSIPLLRAAVCECFINAAQAMGAPVERHARDSRLPLNALEDPTALLPQIPAWRFLERVSGKEGDALFGLRMNQALATNDIKTVAPFLARSPNVFTLLKRFCHSVSSQTNCAHYTIEEAEDHVWVYTNQAKPNHAADQVELFQLTGIMSVLQSALGANWRPLAIDFRFVEPITEIYHSPDLNPSHLRFGRPRAAIAMASPHLSMLLNGASSANDLINTADVGNMPISLKTQVVTAMNSMLSERVPTVARIEDITNLSLRTLQRKLHREGSSFRQLLEQTRLQRAHELLTDTDMPIAEISSLLGYANPPAFTRSFKRWSAITPITYRQVWRQ